MLRKEKKIITDAKEIVQVLNDHYINVVERSCGKETTSVAKQSYLKDDIKIVDHVIRHYEDHPSIRHIKKTYLLSLQPPSPKKKKKKTTCSLLKITEQEIKKILKELSQKNRLELIRYPLSW